MRKIRNELTDHQEVLKKNFQLIEKSVIEISKIIKKTIKKKGIIYMAGNGGSATDSQHFVAELIGRYKKSRKPYSSVSLSSDIGTITCIANDFGYENIFSRQLEALGKRNDLLIAFSTSGNSKNIINLLKTSKKKKIFSICLLGNKGGQSKNLCDYPVIISSMSTARIQEMHQIIYHNVCSLID
tara:strand:- start:57 stop:608 length:552 start_codon:yes stop_codon:yes gene_type:complete